MKAKTVLSVIATGIILLAGNLNAQEAANPNQQEKGIHSRVQIKDPITGNYINRRYYVDVGGKRIFASDSKSLDELRKESGKYLKELEDKGIVLQKLSDIQNAVGKAQVTDPITGNYISKRYYVDIGGKRIYASDSQSLGELRKDPVKYLRELEAKGIILEDVD